MRELTWLREEFAFGQSYFGDKESHWSWERKNGSTSSYTLKFTEQPDKSLSYVVVIKDDVDGWHHCELLAQRLQNQLDGFESDEVRTLQSMLEQALAFKVVCPECGGTCGSFAHHEEADEFMPCGVCNGAGHLTTETAAELWGER